MKVAELSGAQLDYWVAKAEGFPQCGLHTEDGETVCFLGPVAMERFTWAPSTAWEQGGPIIERDGIELHCLDRNGRRMRLWMARHPEKPLPLVFGETALIAAMCAKVASKFGEEVPDL